VTDFNRALMEADHAVKRLILVSACVLTPLAALAEASTGIYCDAGSQQVVSYVCSPGTGLDASWVKQANGCFARTVKGSCAAFSDKSPVFDANQYGVLNSDVATAGIERLTHWKTRGKAEGRATSFGFNVREYLGAPTNADLAAAFGTDWSAAIGHYATNGIYEGRATRLPPAADTGANVYLYNPPFDPPSPRDGSLAYIVTRHGVGPMNRKLETRLDTSNITGIPNTWAVNGGNIVGLPQNLIDSEWGFTGVQQYAGQFGIGIDSRTVKASLDAFHRENKAAHPEQTGALIPVVAASRYEPDALRPWATGQGVRTALELRIPFAGGSAQAGSYGGSQVNTYYHLIDRTSGGERRGFYMGAAIFETRRGTLDAQYAYTRDACGAGCSGHDILNIPMRRLTKGVPNPFMSLSPASGEARYTTFADTAPYEYTVNAAQLQNVIATIKAEYKKRTGTDSPLSNDPADYWVENWNFNPEVFVGIDENGATSGDGWIGTGGRFISYGSY
jgi:hypothetical protein